MTDLPHGPARHRAETVTQLYALAEFIATDDTKPAIVALDYFRLADALATMADGCRAYARIYSGEL